MLATKVAGKEIRVRSFFTRGYAKDIAQLRGTEFVCGEDEKRSVEVEKRRSVVVFDRDLQD